MCLAAAVGVEEGVSGLPLLMGGRNVARGLLGRRPGRPVRPNEVLWDPISTAAAFTAVGTRRSGEVCLAAVTAPVTVVELAKLLLSLGLEDALLLGGSADVHLWTAAATTTTTGPSGAAAAAPAGPVGAEGSERQELRLATPPAASMAGGGRAVSEWEVMEGPARPGSTRPGANRPLNTVILAYLR